MTTLRLGKLVPVLVKNDFLVGYIIKELSKQKALLRQQTIIPCGSRVPQNSLTYSLGLYLQDHIKSSCLQKKCQISNLKQALGLGEQDATAVFR